jgi:hypothetical protein
MLFRVLDYLLQVYKTQLRAWGEEHPTYTGFLFRPVLPIVLYTGQRRWDGLTPFADLTEAGHLFRSVLPEVTPIFLNLSDTADDRLRRDGGPFGQVLRLVRRREAKVAEFRTLLTEALRHLERMPQAERLRWLELLTYLDAFVYHYRETTEQPSLHEVILDSVQSDELRLEVQTMHRTMADEHELRGELRGKRQTLVHQLRTRFGVLPELVAERIEAEQDVAQLDRWLENFATAKRLADVEIE